MRGARDSRVCHAAPECGHEGEEQTDHSAELGVCALGLREGDLEVDQLLVLGVEGHHAGQGTREPGATRGGRDVDRGKQVRIAALGDGDAEAVIVGSAGRRDGRVKCAWVSVWAH